MFNWLRRCWKKLFYYWSKEAKEARELVWKKKMQVREWAHRRYLMCLAGGNWEDPDMTGLLRRGPDGKFQREIIFKDDPMFDSVREGDEIMDKIGPDGQTYREVLRDGEVVYNDLEGCLIPYPYKRRYIKVFRSGDKKAEKDEEPTE